VGYIDLINDFWEMNKEHHFTPNEIAVYFALLNKANSLFWKNPFTNSNNYLSAELGISKDTVKRVKKSLQKRGLIVFNVGNGRRNMTEYTLTQVPINTEGNRKGADPAPLSAPLSASFSTPHHKNKNNTIPPKPPKGEQSEKTWRNDFSIYISELQDAYRALVANKELIKKHEGYNPALDVLKTLAKAYTEFWGIETGWEHYKKKRTKKIDWQKTLINSLSNPLNKVYKSKLNEQEQPSNIVDI
jgi:biotin operon repressor